MALVFCDTCGKQISDKAIKCPHCGNPNIQQSLHHVICKECGEAIYGGSKYCPSCGCPIGIKLESKRVPEKKLSTRLIVLIAVLGTLSVLFVLLVIGSIGYNSDSKVSALEEITEPEDSLKRPILDSEPDSYAMIVAEEGQELGQSKEGKVEKQKRTGTIDFRNVKWGDAPETVRLYEQTAEYYGEDDEMLVYTDYFNGRKIYVIYWFDEKNQLYLVTYLLEGTAYSPGQYLAYYQATIDSVSAKYGEPKTNEVIKYASDDMLKYVDDSTALQLGYTAYYAEWITTRSVIETGVSADGVDINYSLLVYDRTKESIVHDEEL